MSLRLSSEMYISGVLAADRGILSRAITLVESTLPSDRKLAGEVISGVLPHTGGAYRIGITGSPGVGKSTFIDSWGSYLSDQGMGLAVLAVDPSSQVSGGSILGDKTRMERLSKDPRVFIRPSPAGRTLGGVARSTRESLLLCEAAGFDVIVVETVGVGQSEHAVHGMVDFFLLLLLPHAGDELQGIKKGIVEMADALLINKADGALLSKARMAKATFSQALRLFAESESGWKPQVLTCSALNDEGMDEIWSLLEAYRTKMQASGFWEEKRNRQAVLWMEETIRTLLAESFFQHPEMKRKLDSTRKAVIAKQDAPVHAAESLVALWQEIRSRS